MTCLDVEFARSEGALLRLVGLIERKGFEVIGLDMKGPENGRSRATFEIAPRDAGRRTEVLARHVAKQYGVLAVRATEDAAPVLERAS